MACVTNKNFIPLLIAVLCSGTCVIGLCFSLFFGKDDRRKSIPIAAHAEIVVASGPADVEMPDLPHAAVVGRGDAAVCAIPMPHSVPRCGCGAEAGGGGEGEGRERRGV